MIITLQASAERRPSVAQSRRFVLAAGAILVIAGIASAVHAVEVVGQQAPHGANFYCEGTTVPSDQAGPIASASYGELGMLPFGIHCASVDEELATVSVFEGPMYPTWLLYGGLGATCIGSAWMVLGSTRRSTVRKLAK